jgi:TolB protein
MVNRLRRNLLIGVPAALALRPFAAAAQAPLRIEITEGVVEPMPFAAPGFVPDGGAAGDLAARITRVVADDLAGTGLFREIPAQAHIGRVTSFDAPVAFADWKAINAQALITGAVGASGDRAQVRFRLWDVFAQAPLGEGLQFDGSAANWRRLAHKVADAVYSRLTGEGGYFDSRVAFIAASGPKEARRKQLAIMDYDGANPVMLTDGGALVLMPRLAADARQVLYTSYEQGTPKVMLLEGGGRRRAVIEDTAGMTFAPRFSPDGRRVVYSASVGQGSDIFVTDLGGRASTQLTRTASIDTAPAFSPDGNRIVFESDRGGTQQLYVMPASGGEARRISFGQGRYATPVWSPRGDMGAERPGADVLPGNPRGAGRADALFGGHHRAEP